MPALSNQKHERFAQQMALPNAEQRPAYIAAGFTGKTKRSQESAASNLMRRKDIQARVVELRAERERYLAADVERVIREVGPLDDGIFTRVGRARKLVEVARKIEQVIADRAASPDHADIPGGSSCLVVLKSMRNGTKIAAVDTRTVAELRGTYEHIARELGQWVEKAETQQSKKLADLTDEQMNELIAELEAMGAQEAAKKEVNPEAIQ